MSNNDITESGQFPEKLQRITNVVNDAAKSCQGNTTAILQLLRQLEQLHREIRDGTFQESLPNNRQQLYALLKDIESEGGWPYIERMRLQAFLRNMLEAETEEKNNRKVVMIWSMKIALGANFHRNSPLFMLTLT